MWKIIKWRGGILRGCLRIKKNIVIKKEEQLKLAQENLTPEAQQLVLLEEAGKLLEGNNVHLKEQ